MPLGVNGRATSGTKRCGIAAADKTFREPDFDRLIRELQQSLGLTVFMVTHDLNSLVAIADRIAVLVDRKIRVGPLDELLNDPHPWIQAYFRGPRARAAHDAAGSGH